jgi:hypothetical protein
MAKGARMEGVAAASQTTRKVSVPRIANAAPLWNTEGERQAYLRGASDGNSAAVRLLIGVCAPIRLVVDDTIPEGECRLVVRSMDDLVLEGIHLNLLRP